MERTNKPLAGRVALITGASGGIGRGIAQRLGGDGAAVLVHYNSRREPADALVAELTASGERASAAQADLTSSDAVAALFRHAAEALGPVDIVIANAGVAAPRQPIAEVTDETYERVLAANSKATFFVLREAARRVADAGRIVVIGSSTSIYQPAGFSAYAGTKAPTLVLPRILAAELAPRGIAINLLVSGAVDAGFLDNWSADDKAKLAAASPFNRLGTPQDIADVAAFLVGDDARWLSGQTLIANGAATI